MTVQKGYDGQEKCRIRRTNAGKHRRNGAGKRLWWRAAAGSILTYLIYGRNRMNDKKRLSSYDDLPLVLDVADIQRIMGISRVSAYELVHTPGFPAFRRRRLIKVSKIAFFEWMAKGSETVPKSNK